MLLPSHRVFTILIFASSIVSRYVTQYTIYRTFNLLVIVGYIDLSAGHIDISAGHINLSAGHIDLSAGHIDL